MGKATQKAFSHCSVATPRSGREETRAALVWASVVAAPIGLAAQLLIVVAEPSAVLRSVIGVGVLAVLLFFIANCLAEAHRFRSAAGVLGALAGGFALLSVVVLAASAVFA